MAEYVGRKVSRSKVVERTNQHYALNIVESENWWQAIAFTNARTLTLKLDFSIHGRTVIVSMLNN